MKGTILVLGLPVTTEGQQALKTLKEKHNETDFVGVVCDNTRNAFEELLKKTAVDYSNIIGIRERLAFSSLMQLFAESSSLQRRTIGEWCQCGP